VKRTLLSCAAVLLTMTGLPLTQAQAQTVSTASQSWGNVMVGGQLWQKTPFLQTAGTNFFGLWYLIKLFEQHGMTATWNGKALNVTWLPTYHSTATTTVNSAAIATNGTMSIGGNTYVDVTAIVAALHLHSSYDSTTSTLNISSTTVTAALHRHTTRLRRQVHLSTVAVKQSWAAVSGYQNVPVLQSGGTNFFGIWYLIQYLKKYGYTANWNHGTVSMGSLPQVVQQGNLTINGLQQPSALVSMNGHWYVPLSTLNNNLGWSGSTDGQGNAAVNYAVTSVASTTANHSVATYQDGTSQMSVSGGLEVTSTNHQFDKVAIVGSNGLEQTDPLDAAGNFNISIAGPSAEVIGLHRLGGGWIGQAAAVTSSSGAVKLATTQQTANIRGQVVAGSSGESVAQTTVVLRNDITHEHISVQTDASGRFEQTLPVGPWEVWTVNIDGQSMFLGQRFLAQSTVQSVTVPLPGLPSQSTVSSNNFKVVAGNKDVTAVQLLSIDDMFEHVVTRDEETTGITVQNPVTIQVFGDTNAYTQHFIDEAYSQADAQSYGQYSQAVSEGPQSISVNMSNLNDEFGVDVMAHELTHCLIAEVSQNIPSWNNEGIAWHEGIAAQIDISPSTTLLRSLEWNQWEEIVSQQSKGTLFALGQADSLAPQYNVESQDYQAMNKLIGQYGLVKVMDYVRVIDSEGESVAFQNTFGVTENDFMSQMTQTLVQEAAQSPQSFTVTLQVQSGGPTSLFVSNPKGSTVWFDHVSPGIYTFTCNADGAVTPPPGLTQNKPQTDSGDGSWYIGGESGSSQAEFAINNSFNLAYLEDTALFANGNNMGIISTATSVPIGLELLSVNAAK